MDWSGLAQDRGNLKTLVKVVMNILFSQNAGKFSSGCTTWAFRVVFSSIELFS
jgi:hypothetical protein